MTRLTVDLSPEARARLEQEALSRGLTLEAVAAEALEAWGSDDEELDWAEDFRRLEEPGEDVDVKDAFDRLTPGSPRLASR